MDSSQIPNAMATDEDILSNDQRALEPFAKKHCKSNRDASASSTFLATLSSSSVTPEEQLSSCLDMLEQRFMAAYGSTHRLYATLEQRVQNKGSACEFLPNEVFLHVISFLYNDPITLARMAQVCRNWRRLTTRPCIWQKVCRRLWNCNSIADVNLRLFKIVGQCDYHPALVEVAPLIKAGADLSAVYGQQKVTPLLMAAYHGHLNVVKFLVKCGSSLKEKSVFGRSPLLCAAWGGHPEVVAWLYHNGCDVTERDMHGHTPLLCAAMSGSRPTCAWLRDQGAQLTERNHLGLTPLHCASFIGNVELMNWMLSTGSSLAERSIVWDTPLLCACRTGHLAAIKFALRKGATFDEKTLIGENGLMLASIGIAPPGDNRFAEVAAFILQQGLVHVGDTDQYGCTAMHMARMSGNLGVLHVLHQFGGQDTVRNRFGATPADDQAILQAIRTRQQNRLVEVMQTISGIVLKFNCNNRENLTDYDLRFLFKALESNATIHTVVLLSTSIDVRRCKDCILELLEQNRFITSLYFGERAEHTLPEDIVEKLKENQLAGLAGQPVQPHHP